MGGSGHIQRGRSQLGRSSKKGPLPLSLGVSLHLHNLCSEKDLKGHGVFRWVTDMVRALLTERVLLPAEGRRGPGFEPCVILGPSRPLLASGDDDPC